MKMSLGEAFRFKFKSNTVWKCVMASLAVLGCSSHSYAFDFAGDSDVSVRWDNTFKYSLMQRLKDPSSNLVSPPTMPPVLPPAGNIAGSDFGAGDNNFHKGIASKRLDWLSELDVTYHEWTGFRLSGDAWYDSVYNNSNKFSEATQDLMGRKAELLDAFVFANGDLDDKPLSVRFGKHTVLYGETLFFGQNGIAGGQAPVDVIKLLSVPDSTFKEVLLPVEQLSGQIQLSSNVTVGVYYQLKWLRTRTPPSGSYFNNFNPVDVGGTQGYLFTGAPTAFGGPVNTITRTGDIVAKDSGQGGLQLRIRPESMDTDFGFYATQYHDKTPQIYIFPMSAPLPPVPLTYNLVFPEDIRSYGASFSTVFGLANVAGEVSVRRNTPLVSHIIILNQAQAAVADNNSNPFYAVGNSAHANLSTIISLSPSSLWQGGSLLGEVAWNRRTSITQNPTALDPNVDRDAWGFRTVFEPAYYQVSPGLDISVPIGLGYNPHGKSSVVAAFNGGVDHGGDLSIGVNGDYQRVWKLSAKYTHYLGSENVLAIPSVSPNSPLMNSFGQTFKDRDFIVFSIQRTF